MNYREFADYAKDSAREVGQHFEQPDDDWTPMLLMEGPEGAVVIGLDTMFFKDHVSKNALAAAIADKLRQERAHVAAMVQTVWYIERPPDAIERAIDAPDRQERLMVSVVDRERVEVWLAPVLRDGEQPPAVGDWAGGVDADGRFVNALQGAMR